MKIIYAGQTAPITRPQPNFHDGEHEPYRQTKSNGIYKTNGIEAQSDHRSYDYFDIVSYIDEFKT